MRSIFHLEDLGREGDDLHEVVLAELARDGPEDAGAARVALVVDDHGGVLVERDRRAVVAAVRLARPHDHGLDDLALLDRPLRRRLLDGADDYVADARVAALRSPLDADAEDLAGAGVVGNAESGLLLNHLAASTTRARRQFFVFESGRVSTISTMSPTLASFCSSWAWNLTLRRTTFL